MCGNDGNNVDSAMRAQGGGSTTASSSWVSPSWGEMQTLRNELTETKRRLEDLELRMKTKEAGKQ